MITEQDITRWKYNCLDVLYTLEIAEILEQQVKLSSNKPQEFIDFQLHDIPQAVVATMNRGIRIDLEKKEELHKQLTQLLIEVQEKVDYIVGEPLKVNSYPQVKNLLKDLCRIKLKVDKKSKSESCASAYMLDYIIEYPEYKPLITLILEYRSIRVFLKTFVEAKVDEDGRMRTSYNVAGTKTYRLSSRKNAFGCGLNMANIPSKGKIDLKYSLESIDNEENIDEDTFITGDYEGITSLPNCKDFFIPDIGYKFFNVDYSGADAMVVAWDSDCKWLQNFFLTSNEKLYIYIASHFLGEQIDQSSKWYKIFKMWCHGTNYGMMEEKAAQQARIDSKLSKQLRQWYFKLCPEIPDWHKRISSDVKNKGYIENIFGARGWFLNKDCPTLLNQAIAWIPQSTIAILVNKGWVNIYKNEKNIHILMQVHDALAGQFLITDKTAETRIIKHMSIELPYKKPLTIPVDISTSLLSYGDCK
jgi:DNA polymerase I-like protein with 3'-5' exonuclease and polymerase domains